MRAKPVTKNGNQTENSIMLSGKCAYDYEHRRRGFTTLPQIGKHLTAIVIVNIIINLRLFLFPETSNNSYFTIIMFPAHIIFYNALSQGAG